MMLSFSPLFRRTVTSATEHSLTRDLASWTIFKKPGACCGGIVITSVSRRFAEALESHTLLRSVAKRFGLQHSQQQFRHQLIQPLERQPAGRQRGHVERHLLELLRGVLA